VCHVIALLHCTLLQVIEGGTNQKLKPAWGADVLRLWVSTVDYSGDVPVGDNILKQVCVLLLVVLQLQLLSLLLSYC
jgi:isoleucyl-tRNA synthetase